MAATMEAAELALAAAGICARMGNHKPLSTERGPVAQVSAKQPTEPARGRAARRRLGGATTAGRVKRGVTVGCVRQPRDIFSDEIFILNLYLVTQRSALFHVGYNLYYVSKAGATRVSRTWDRNVLRTHLHGTKFLFLRHRR